MEYVQYLSNIKIPAYRVCMQCTDSTSQGIILSCILKQMMLNSETKGVIIPNKIITQNNVHLNDLFLFQKTPPSFIKTTLINPTICMYTIDMEQLLNRLKETSI